MPNRFSPLARLAVATLLATSLATSLAGCGTVNQGLVANVGDYIPQWAGGLPADAPPRPGTPQYDAWMKERERLRLMPAAEREAAKGTAKPDQSKVDPVH